MEISRVTKYTDNFGKYIIILCSALQMMQTGIKSGKHKNMLLWSHVNFHLAVYFFASYNGKDFLFFSVFEEKSENVKKLVFN